MSKLSEMIARLCPNGVEYRKIKDTFKRLRGTPITAGQMKQIQNDDGEIMIFAGGKTAVRAKEKDILRANITRVPAVLVQSRGIIYFIYCDKPFTFKNEMWAYTADDPITVKYLYYVLQNNAKAFREAASGMGALPQISLKVTEDFSIPLPPLPVQREIVQILDNFANLTAELTAELAKRKKQYEHYRDMLLNFTGGGRYDKFGVESGEFRVEWKRLGEICDMVTDYTAAGSFADIARNVEYKREVDFAQLVRTTDIKSRFTKEAQIFISESAYKYLWRVHLDQASIVLPNIGNCGEVYFITPDILPYKKSALAPNALLIRSSNIDLKFLYYWFTGDDFQKRLKKIVSPVGQGKFNKTELKQLLIPLPPLAEQERIVAILDRFDSLCNSLTEGLPAEIALRKKQYEYYRDKLLSFKEAG